MSAARTPTWNATPAIVVALAKFMELHARALRVEQVRRTRGAEHIVDLVRRRNGT